MNGLLLIPEASERRNEIFIIFINRVGRVVVALRSRLTSNTADTLEILIFTHRLPMITMVKTK